MAAKASQKTPVDPESGAEELDDDGNPTPLQARRNFRRAFEAKERFLEAAMEDILFALGHQWADEDIKTLEAAGVRPITINQIAPVLRLLKGIESQNRTELRAYPEGGEDDVTAEIVSRLLKSAGKQCDLDYKFSEMFDNGNTVGRSTLEPYLEYPFEADAKGYVDLSARLCGRIRHHNVCYEDPSSVEYDHSDAGYYCKFTPDLSRQELINFFPKFEAKIRAAKSGKIDVTAIPLDLDGVGVEVQRKGYNESDRASWIPKNGFDLLDYYFKKWTETWYVTDASIGKTVKAPDKKTAMLYLENATKNEKPGQETSKVFSRFQPEIWVGFQTGGDLKDEWLYLGPAWSAKLWDGYPLFDYYAYRSTAPVEQKYRALLIQGITRGAKDSNRELNKRRTQELRHLNQSTSTGWIMQDDAMTIKQEQHLRKFGGTPGVIVKFIAGKPSPVRIEPTQLSIGHAQMAKEHTQDMRDTVGLNTETLAIESDQSSGRAIANRIKQGMTQVQGLFDNYARTRRNVGRFLIAILAKLFDVDKAKRVLGQAFLNENFQSPVVAPVVNPQTGQPVVDPKTGKPAMAPSVDPRTGQPQMQYDDNLATQVLTQILTDTQVGQYDVSVGEIVAATTTMMGQFQEALELRAQGVPIPPDVLVSRSSMPDSDKKKTIAALAAEAQAAQAAPPSKNKAA